MFEMIGLTSQSELLANIQKGGWVVSTLILMSLIAATVAFAKISQLTRLTFGQQQKLDHLLKKLPTEDQLELEEDLEQLRHPVASPMQPIVSANIRSAEDIEMVKDEVERLSLRQMDSLNVGLKLLGLIATIAPLLGLLGTVLGMIEAFQKLQQAGNKVDPSILSGGIWEALLTTAAGLLVAIPVTVVLNWLQGRVTKIARTMEDTLSIALTTLKLRSFPQETPESRAA